MFYIYIGVPNSGTQYNAKDWVTRVESLALYAPPEHHIAIALNIEGVPQQNIVYPYEKVWLFTPECGWYQDVELWKHFGLFFEDCSKE